MAHLRRLTNILPQPARFWLRKAAFFGRAHRCVLCLSHIRAYGPHGGGPAVADRRQVVGGMRREGDRCPVCHGRDRTRLFMLYLESRLGVGTRPMRVLHVAPDLGLYLWLKRQPAVDHVGTDIDVARYRHIEGIRTADLTAAPFPDDSFDAILCSHVLEHIPDDRTAFAELFRILRPGGAALLLTPYALDGAGTDEDPAIRDPAERERRFGQWDHVRLYDRDDFIGRMRAAGFRTELFDALEDDPARAAALHLNPLEKLPVGHKPAT